MKDYLCDFSHARIVNNHSLINKHAFMYCSKPKELIGNAKQAK
jgi:hypothetical protein